MPKIDHATLLEWLRYVPETGEFHWLKSPSPGVFPGDIAGTPFAGGGKRIGLKREQLLSHRLAWFYVHKEWPTQIDHIDGDRNNNRLANLRAANNSQNQANMPAKSNSKLGIRGVGFRRGRYHVQLKRGNIKVSKWFKTLEDATAFARLKSLELHGEYSIHSRELGSNRGVATNQRRREDAAI